jgi:hypothetical protein
MDLGNVAGGRDRSIWYKDAVSCQAYIFLVLDERNVSVDRLCSDTEWGQLRYWEKNLFQCHLAHYDSHTKWPASKRTVRSDRWESNGLSLDTNLGSNCTV